MRIECEFPGFSYQEAVNFLEWVDFDKLYDIILLELHNELHQEELPWLYDEVLDTMKKNIVAVREKRSFDWTEKILNQEPDIKVMGSANANQLYNSITNPPAYIISSHLDKLAKVNASLYNRLSEIKLEWLIEKFKELPDKEQEKFLELALSTLS